MKLWNGGGGGGGGMVQWCSASEPAAVAIKATNQRLKEVSRQDGRTGQECDILSM